MNRLAVAATYTAMAGIAALLLTSLYRFLAALHPSAATGAAVVAVALGMTLTVLLAPSMLRAVRRR